MNHPSAVLRRVLQLTRNPELVPATLITAIEVDPPFSERLVRYVEVFYGARAVRGDLKRAVQLLGPLSVRYLASQHALVEVVNGLGLPDNVKGTIWGDAVFRAVAARLIARHTNMAHIELAFSAALAAELGAAVALARSGQFVAWMCDVRPLTGPRRLEAERQVLGQDHVQALLSAIRTWDLPGDACTAIERHHPAPGAQPSGAATVVSWADRLGEAITSSAPLPALDRWVRGVGDLGIPVETAWKIVESSLAAVPRVANVIGVNAAPLPSLQSLRAEGGAGGGPSTMEEVRAYAEGVVFENSTLKKRVEALETELEVARQRDLLTGLPDLRGLIKVLREQLAKPAIQAPGVALLLIDLDGFDEVNARLGYGVGDQLLRAVGALLRDSARQGEIVGRLQGDTFAWITRADARAARLQGERLRQVIEQHRFDLDDRRHRLTVTMAGVVAADLGDHPSADELITVARRTLADHATGGANRLWWYQPVAEPRWASA